MAEEKEKPQKPEEENKKPSLAKRLALALALPATETALRVIGSRESRKDDSGLKTRLRTARPEVEFRDISRSDIPLAFGLKQPSWMPRGLMGGLGRGTSLNLDLPPDQLKALQERAAKGHPLKIKVPGATMEVTPEHFGKKYVWSWKHGPALETAHELEHLKDSPKAVKRYAQLSSAAELISPLAVGGSVLGGMLTKSPERARHLGTAGAIVSGMSSLPGLFREGKAELGALKTLGRSGMSRKEVLHQALTRSLPTLGSQVLRAAGPPLAAILLSRAIAARKEKKLREEKERKEEPQEKQASVAGYAAIFGVASLLGGFAVYDFFKSRQFPTVTQADILGLPKDRVNSHEYLAKLLKDKPLRRPPVVITSFEEPTFTSLVEHFSAESGTSVSAAESVLKRLLKPYLTSNAAVIQTPDIDYILMPPAVHRAAVEHEVGHLREHDKGIKKPTLSQNLLASFWKPSLQKYVLNREREAWKEVAPFEGKEEYEKKMVGSYEKGFHQRRGLTSGSLAAALAATGLLALLDNR